MVNAFSLRLVIIRLFVDQKLTHYSNKTTEKLNEINCHINVLCTLSNVIVMERVKYR